jgi:Tfp pilus assembly protein PilX
MSTGAIVAIIVVVLVVVVVLAVLAAANRRRRLRERFGPEYDRAVTEHDSKRQAEAELAERERRVSKLNIRPLNPAARAKYSSEWTAVQEQFVDAPQAAVTGAQTLIVAVMTDRGYPTEDHDQAVADLSVEHASTMDRYRAAHAISERAAAGSASTEDLRQAMVDYRSLFAELLGEPAAAGTAPADGDPAHTAQAGTAPAGTAPAGTVPDGTAPADAVSAEEAASTGRTTPRAGPAERIPASDVREPVASDVPTRPDPADPAATDETVDPATGAPVASRPRER